MRCRPCEVFAAAIRAVDTDLGAAGSRDGQRRGQLKRADTFQKKLTAALSQVRDHPHVPLSEDDGSECRKECDGLVCGMWELCWTFSGIALHFG